MGGVRVKEVIDRNHPSARADTTRFLYSDGFLYNMPRYAFRCPIQHLPANQQDATVPEYNVTGYNGDVDYSVSGDRFVGYADVTRIHPDHSRTETVTDYFGGQGLATVRGREYNAYGQVACESVSSPQQPGETLRTHFVYAHEAGLSNSSIALPSALYTVAKTRTINGTRYLLAGEYYKYINFSIHIKPYQVHRFFYASPQAISPLIPGAANFTNLTGDQVFTFQYDPVTLFPTRVDRPGEAWTTYSWTGIHLTGRSENASDNHFTYTWQDLVGLKTLTTPAGTTETYEYDGHGRLYQVKDTDGSVVGVNHYHLTHE